MNLNRIFVVGRLTGDPELKSTPGGQSVATFSVATNNIYTDKAGQKHEDAEFHRIVAWGKTAELCKTYLVKGQEVLVEGRVQTRSWEDKNGGGKRYMTEIIADRVQFGAKPTGAAAQAKAASTVAPAPEEMVPIIDVDAEGDIRPEDLPF